MKLRYSPRALAQLGAILEYFESDNPPAATAFLKRFERLVQLIETFPLTGRPTDKPEVRIVGIPQYRYVIFYRVLVDQDEVRILRIRHTSRRPTKDYR